MITAWVVTGKSPLRSVRKSGCPFPPNPASFSNDLHQNPLPPLPVKLAVEDLLPRSKVQLPLGDGDDDLAAHDLPLYVGVGVVLTGAVVVVLGRGGVGGELLQPDLVVVMQAALVVVDENRRSAMRCLFVT